MAAEAEVSSQFQTANNGASTSAAYNTHWPTTSLTDHCLQASFIPHGRTFALPTSLCPERLTKQPSLPGIEAERSFCHADCEDAGLPAQPRKFKLPVGPPPPSGLPWLRRTMLAVSAPPEFGFRLSLRSLLLSSDDLQRQQGIHPQNCGLKSLGSVGSPRFGSSLPSTADTMSFGPSASSTAVFAIPTTLRKCDAEEPLPLEEICTDVWEEPMPADNSCTDSWRAVSRFSECHAEELMPIEKSSTSSWRGFDAEELMPTEDSCIASRRAADAEEHMRLKNSYKDSWMAVAKLNQDHSSPIGSACSCGIKLDVHGDRICSCGAYQRADCTRSTQFPPAGPDTPKIRWREVDC